MRRTRSNNHHDHRSDDETRRRPVVRGVRVMSANLWVLAIRDVDTELPKRAVAAALVLRSFMNQRATCWPVVATIAGGMRASDRTVQRALQELEAGGWVLRTSRGPRLGSKYSAALPEDAHLVARLREHIAKRRDAPALMEHLPAGHAGVTPVTPRSPSGVTTASSEVTPMSPKDPLKIHNPPPIPPAVTVPTGTGAGNLLLTPPVRSSESDQSPDDHRRPEYLSDLEWAAWQVDPLQPANTTTYQWACFRRAIEAIAPQIGDEAYGLVLGRHWQAFRKRRELVVLMRHCADIDRDATRAAVVQRRYGLLPYAGADNIPAAMLARLRALAADLDRRQVAPTWQKFEQLPPEVEQYLARLGT